MKSGNMRAWNSISEEVIEKSFVVCGQSKFCTPEDISCLKEGQIGHDAFDAVSKLWNNPHKINLSKF